MGGNNSVHVSGDGLSRFHMRRPAIRETLEEKQSSSNSSSKQCHKDQ